MIDIDHFLLLSSLKKGKPSERETARLTKVGQVETVIDVGDGYY